MAKTEAGRSAPGSLYTKLWMFAAIVVVAAFMVWLAVTSEPSTVAMVETTTEETTESAGASVTAEEFEANVAQYVGQTVNLSGLRVAGRVGEQAFWVELPSGSPYLVKMSDALVAEGFAVQSGDPVDVLGRVHQMTDSVVAAWEASGAIQGEGQKAEVLYATTFLEAIRARVGGSTPASE